MGMSACGLTDHGTFAGAIQFLSLCRKHSIRPVLGCEFYLSRNHQARNKDTQPDGRKGNRHINLFAKSLVGYQNICALSQAASVDGYYYDPRVDAELLYKHREGVLCSSACLSNIVNALLLRDKYDKAKKAVSLFKDIYGEDYYMEMMFHGIDAEAKILPDIQKLAKEMDVKVIATNDVHYPKKSDAQYHSVVICMSTGRTLKDPNRLKFPYEEFYFKSKEEMYKLFGHIPSALNNTLEVAEKCDYSDLIFIEQGGSMKLPKFNLPSNYSTPYSYLHDLAWQGFKRLGLESSEPHKKRLELELSDVKLIWDTKKYDFATYFLIVQDIMRYAKENDISSSIRGSGYGSLMLKCLGIVESSIDCIEYGLFWERFLGFSDSHFFCDADFGIKS
jgi:DNA polymerase III subunit alpha